METEWDWQFTILKGGKIYCILFKNLRSQSQLRYSVATTDNHQFSRFRDRMNWCRKKGSLGLTGGKENGI